MPTYTLYATSESGVLHSKNTNADLARAGSNLAENSSGSPDYSVGQYRDPSTSSPRYYHVFALALEFDTSSVVGYVESATLKLRCKDDNSQRDFRLKVLKWGPGNTLGVEDWKDADQLATLVLLAEIGSERFVAEGFLEFAQTPSFPLWIDEDKTKLLVVSQRVMNRLVPISSEDEVVSFYGPAYAGNDHDPVLIIITHEAQSLSGILEAEIAMGGPDHFSGVKKVDGFLTLEHRTGLTGIGEDTTPRLTLDVTASLSLTGGRDFAHEDYDLLVLSPLHLDARIL